ncbi:MAG: DUF126 domain-containing protein [Cenarchaeum sp. SB0665_bin_23]|nr:DUF126 domain-containing protein [Cenarchaeum sp. SB0665_bin_23]MYG33319.1 DUF126 domain-containing protein [Cenarchaeum sp. SB0677_bin_16]
MRRLVGGRATGILTHTHQPINFLGMVNKDTGIVQDASHDLYGRSLQDTILALPYGIGSSVGAYTIYSIKSNNAAPSAILCERSDLTVATGCAVANIPLAILDTFEMESLHDNSKITVDVDAGMILYN